VIEQRIGSLDDQAWKRMRQRLIEFILTLQSWDEQQKVAAVEDKQRCPQKNQSAA
jgi:hypothetical protein